VRAADGFGQDHGNVDDLKEIERHSEEMQPLKHLFKASHSPYIYFSVSKYIHIG